MTNISLTNNIICPFCIKDHTQTNTDYIKIVEITDTTDRDKWVPWWEKHLDIFIR